jgi:hypothetical protein
LARFEPFDLPSGFGCIRGPALGCNEVAGAGEREINPASLAVEFEAGFSEADISFGSSAPAEDSAAVVIEL